MATSTLAADFAGLESFAADAAAGKRPKPRKVIAKEGASAVEVLKSVLSANFGQIIKLLQEWDDNGDNMVSAKEFRQALPMLGLQVEREDAIALFNEWDADGSGQLDYKELQKVLRPGASVELAAELQAGAAGEIETYETMRAKAKEKHQHHGLLKGVSTVLGKALVSNGSVSIIEQLQEALEDGADGAHEALLWEKMQEYADKVCEYECKDELEEVQGLW